MIFGSEFTGLNLISERPISGLAGIASHTSRTWSLRSLNAEMVGANLFLRLGNQCPAGMIVKMKSDNG
jgi:hypothetical protein